MYSAIAVWSGLGALFMLYRLVQRVVERGATIADVPNIALAAVVCVLLGALWGPLAAVIDDDE